MFRLFKEIRVKILIGYLLLIVIAFFSVFFLFDKFSRLSLPDEEEVGRATVRIVSRKPRLLAKLRGYRYHREAVSAAEYHQDIPQPMRQRVLRHHAITICREMCVGRPLRRYFTQSLRLWVIRMAQKFGPHIVQYSPSFLDPSL